MKKIILLAVLGAFLLSTSLVSVAQTPALTLQQGDTNSGTRTWRDDKCHNKKKQYCDKDSAKCAKKCDDKSKYEGKDTSNCEKKEKKHYRKHKCCDKDFSEKK